MLGKEKKKNLWCASIRFLSQSNITAVSGKKNPRVQRGPLWRPRQVHTWPGFVLDGFDHGSDGTTGWTCEPDEPLRDSSLTRLFEELGVQNSH